MPKEAIRGIVNAVTGLKGTKAEETPRAFHTGTHAPEVGPQPGENGQAIDEVTQRSLEWALGAVRMVLHCADHEITSWTFILDRMRDFGIPYNEWSEMWQLDRRENKKLAGDEAFFSTSG